MVRRAARSRRKAETRRSLMLARLGFVKRGKRSARTGSARTKRSSPGARLPGRLAHLAPSHWNFAFGYRQIVPALAAAVVVALGMAVLRIDLIRSRYEIGVNISEEQRLSDEIALRTARMRELRDPLVLSLRAEELGFVPPQELVDLPSLATSALPWARANHFVRLASGRTDRP